MEGCVMGDVHQLHRAAIAYNKAGKARGGKKSK
jgi:hypothetical protein